MPPMEGHHVALPVGSLEDGPLTESQEAASQRLLEEQLQSSDGSSGNHRQGEDLRHEMHLREETPETLESSIKENLESLDYEVAETEQSMIQRTGETAIKWVLALLLGLGTGLASFFINIAVEYFAGFKFTATFFLMHYSYLLAFLIYATFNVGLVYSSAFIVTHFAPAAAGSGIPEIKGYLNGIDTPGILLFRTLIGKIFGSIGSVAGGLALGKEGPLVHTGACIASLLGQGGIAHYRLSWRFLRVFQNDRDRRDLVTCGAAAGAAAAFRAPVGGVLFALEEVTSWWRSQLMWRVFFTSAVVTVVLRSLMRWCSRDRCSVFGEGGFIIWDVHGGQDDYSPFELLPMAMLGVMGGLLGALFNQLTLYVSAWRRNYLHPKGANVKVMEACAVALLTSILSFYLPLLQTCTPCPDPIKYPDLVCPRPSDTTGNFVNFSCPNENEYNDLATIFFNTQDDAIRNLFSSRTINEYNAYTLIAFLVIFFSLAVLTYGLAVPAGQFVPGIMIGATYGRIVGILMVKMYGKDEIDEGTYALLGAASFLGGSMRMTVSLCVIMVEITNNLNLLPLIMLVLLVSKAVGDGFNGGFYDVHCELRKIPILEPQPVPKMMSLTAKDAASQKVVQFSRIERVGHILEVLESTTHNGFPVIEEMPDGSTQCIGLILRSHLLVLLKSRADFQHRGTPQTLRLRNISRYDASEFSKPASAGGLTLDEVHVAPLERAMWLDLKPFVNPSPYIVEQGMSLAKVHTLFRQLGLRHLVVVESPPKVVGIITRKDLLNQHVDQWHHHDEDEEVRDSIGEVGSHRLSEAH